MPSLALLCGFRAGDAAVCAAFNGVVLSHLSETMSNAYVVSSLGCQSAGDQFHFNAEGMTDVSKEKMNSNQGNQNYYSSHPDHVVNPNILRPDAKERPGLREMAMMFGRAER